MAAIRREVDRQLCDAAEDGDVAGIRAALQAGANVNAGEGTWDWTPLHWSALYGRVGSIEALLAVGAHVDGADGDGRTPLMLAVQRERDVAAVALLAAGADVNFADGMDETALHVACKETGSVDCARELLDAGARTDVRNMYGKRPIDVVRAELCCSALCCRGEAAASSRAMRVYCAQVGARSWDLSATSALRALLIAAEPWSRRRAAAMACYGGVWPSWEEE